MVIDDNALYRQSEIFHMIDPSQVGPRHHTPPYICAEMGGEIGCCSNGIGLSLATADLVHVFDGIPGSVVNIGSEIFEHRLVHGLRMLKQKNMKVILLNLFTGLHDGEKIAHVIKNEVSQIPMIVRLEGTNGAGGRDLLNTLQPRCIATDSLDDAVRKAIVKAS
jgi:succinyl-CoA synthetase beta subunit